MTRLWTIGLRSIRYGTVDQSSLCPQIKYIADPGMHSIPAVSVHPNGKWLCGQSLDNQIVTYSALDKYRQNKKKVFKGHTSSGYACQVRRLRHTPS